MNLLAFHVQSASSKSEVLAAWPGVFSLDYFDRVDLWSDVALNGVIAYVSWFIPFVTESARAHSYFSS